MDSGNLPISPFHRLICAYAPAERRARFLALFSYDAALADVIRSNREAMIGLIRLQWWRDVIAQDPDQRPRGNPVIEAINILADQDDVRPYLLRMLDGWERLIEDAKPDVDALRAYAGERGTALFQAIALDCGADIMEQAARLGSIWARWDLSRHHSDPAFVASLRADLEEDQVWLAALTLPRSLRPMLILARLIRVDILADRPDRSLMRPATALRIIWHGLTGV